MQLPSVSIITPAYNAQHFIAETIQTVLSQTFSNWEMIIVDDGSVDKTAEIIKPYLKDSRIKYIYQKNGKQGKARNLAIKNSSGEYLAFLDSDDLWVPEKLEKQIDIFKNNNIDVLYSQGWRFTDGHIDAKVNFDAPYGLQDFNLFFPALLHKNFIPVLSVLVKKEIVLKVNCFNEDPRIQNTEDYHLWLKLADAKYAFFGMQERLFYYRLHPTQSTMDYSGTIIPKTWTLLNIQYTSFEKKEVKKIAESNLDSIVSKYIDKWENKKIHAIIDLYKNPISNYKKYIALKLAYCFGKQLLTRAWYRFFKHKIKPVYHKYSNAKEIKK